MRQLKKTNCKKCGEVRFIVNNTYCLCQGCNDLRLGNDKKKVWKKKPKTSLRKVSEKERGVKKELGKIYQDMANRGEFSYCESCGSSQYLQHSHLVPRSFNKGLTTHSENIICQCQNCHSIYEARDIGGMQKFHNYQEILDRLRFLDIRFFLIIQDKIEKHERKTKES